MGPGLSWWDLAMVTVFCASLVANFVLLAENRLLLPSDNRSTALRLGFLAQLLVMSAWLLSDILEAGTSSAQAGAGMLGFGAIHLAFVATFAVSEDLVLPRRAMLARQALPRWRQVLAPLQPGGANGALYVLLQMVVLFLAGWALRVDTSMLHWFVVACGYICFFSGVPVLLFRAMRPYEAASFRLRVAVLVLLAMSVVVPDLLAYMLWQRDGLDLSFSLRHLVNPFRTLANIRFTSKSYSALAELIGVTGVLAYVVLIRIGAGVTLDPDRDDPETAAEEPGRANVLS
jgi:hypothetical protein